MEVSKYAENLPASVPAILRPVISLILKAIAQLIQFCPLTILKVGLLVSLKDQKLLSLVLQPECSGTVLYNTFKYLTKKHTLLMAYF